MLEVEPGGESLPPQDKDSTRLISAPGNAKHRPSEKVLNAAAAAVEHAQSWRVNPEDERMNAVGVNTESHGQ